MTTAATLRRADRVWPTLRFFTLSALSALVLGACSPGRLQEAAELLQDIAASTEARDGPAIAPLPTRRAFRFASGGREIRADLYFIPELENAKETPAGLVLVPGLAAGGKDDPRLVGLAHALARVRFRVLVPEIGGLKQIRASADDPRAVAAAAVALEEHLKSDGSEPNIGVAGISYAAGPGLLAALSDEARASIDFVFSVGGYYDLKAAITFFTTGRYRENPDRPWRYRVPNAYGKWAFARNNADRVTDPQDRILLHAMAERKLRKLDAPIDDLVPRLGAEGRAVYALLENQDPDKVPILVLALPSAIRRDIEALDVSRRDLSRLRARLILVHGRDDAIIPWTESAALARAAPHGLAELYLVDNLAHVELQKGDLGDTVTLWEAAYRLLEERDR